ncbi:MauE/DoxX family redox-associated membrane protein [Engelhardtia mirabilis]|uniref:Methylamine utilisation protein MauE domain-containing protein n=1 Tax=Engelhardtia mirabilis TaxID=2528011 RepID=A0A518BF22_9BACT|nr:hypothetical protein Pla133_06310 [Planctomycetes bacterium Pla133]QDU99891.1 hypothetical protein Pla86_06300 [Planctomycetes bacterium Pla86]
MSDSPAADGPRLRPLALLALALASVWILTGALFKLLQGSPALLPKFMHELPISVTTLYPLVIGIELAIVGFAWLRPRQGWALIALQYLAFFGVLGIQIARGEESCGCMGKNVSLAPTTMLAIDGTLFALLLISRPWSGLGRFVMPLPVAAIAAIALFALPHFVGRGQAMDPSQVRAMREGASGAGIDKSPTADPDGAASRSQDEAQQMASAEPAPGSASSEAATTHGATQPQAPAPSPVEDVDEVVAPAQGWTIIAPEDWVGKDVFDIDLAQWVDVASLPLDGTWILYRTTCEHCRDHLIDVTNADDGSELIGLIRVPDPGDSPENRIVHIMPQGGHVMHVELPRGVEYVVTTPADAEIMGGVVQAAREGIEY